VSLGLPYTQAYFSLVAKAIEDAFALGVLTVVSAGNSGNIPQIMIGAAATPNALAVGATGVPETNMEATMATYSSRGPGDNDVAVKPDISAPGGKFSLAAAALGHIYFEGVDGTSYSAPIVAGAAALIKQYCPECSPFAIKALLMNNAIRNIQYFASVDAKNYRHQEIAPISWLGAGEVQIHKALTADYWAYCVQDAQPSLSLGTHNVVADFNLTKTIRIININDIVSTGGDAPPLPLTLSVSWRDPDDAASGAVQIAIAPQVIPLGRACGAEAEVQVTFTITAANVPANHMTTAGKASNDFRRLDANEFDGWIVISSITSSPRKDISLPFHMILRRASNVVVANPILPALTSNPQVVAIGLVNQGAGTAQIDTYQLLYISEDDPEFGFGSRKPSADLRFVGYRTIPLFEPKCSYMVEFAFHTWERTLTSVNTMFEALLDLDGDLTTDIVLSNHGPHQHKTSYTECRIYNVSSGTMSCAGYAPEHPFDSSNTVIRACSEDLGLSSSNNSNSSRVLNVRFTTSSFATVTHRADSTSTVQISFPEPALSGPSFDVLPNETWSKIEVRGKGSVPDGAVARGLVMFTNGWRSNNSTGASRRDREAIPLTFESVALPTEVTADTIKYPRATVFDGPICSTWKQGLEQCSFQRNPALIGVLSLDELFGGAPPVQPNDFLDDNESCTENNYKKQQLATQFPTAAPTVSYEEPVEVPATNRTLPRQSPTDTEPNKSSGTADESLTPATSGATTTTTTTLVVSAFVYSGASLLLLMMLSLCFDGYNLW
jgi:Subtilase family